MAALPGFADLHPYQDEDEVQGVLELLWRLEQALLAITGMRRITLQPSAGAHGELVGILMIRAYHRAHGGAARDTVIVPDSAHGTNLATATMAGYRVVELPSSDRGLIDLGALRGRSLRPDRRSDAHQPQYAGPVRGGHPRDHPLGPRGRRPWSTTTAPTSTPSWARPGRATWAWTSCT